MPPGDVMTGLNFGWVRGRFRRRRRGHGTMRLFRDSHGWILGAVAACALATPATAAARCAGADLRPAAGNLDTIRSATLCLVNVERSARGLNVLAENERLTEASNAYAQAMVRRRFFAHVDPDGTTLSERLFKYGYLVDSAPKWLAGENIAWAQRALSTPGEVVEAWMRSPGHRENILESRFREIGLGVALGSPEGDPPDQAATYTTDFGMLDHERVDDAAPAPSSTTRPVSSSLRSSSAAKRRALRSCARRAAKAAKAAKGSGASRSGGSGT